MYCTQKLCVVLCVCDFIYFYHLFSFSPFPPLPVLLIVHVTVSDFLCILRAIASCDVYRYICTGTGCTSVPYRAGISFVAVHDSYWTHACFVDTMNRVSLKG